MFVGAPHRHYKASRIAFRKYRIVIPRMCVDKISHEMKERNECKPHIAFVTFIFGVVVYDDTEMMLQRRKSHGNGYTNQRHTKLITLQV